MGIYHKENLNQEHLEERARGLTTDGGNIPTHNGIERILVTLEPPPSSSFAWLDVEFYGHTLALNDILTDVNINNTKHPQDIFTINGGSRLRAGHGPGQVQVTSVQLGSTHSRLRLRVEPIGDYSTYTLKIDTEAYDIDPVFARKDFKFRPGCFNTNCAPFSSYEAPLSEPVIDYLARDFESFKHVLINAMRTRVPNWQPTSEADLDQVLIDLIAADADDLADLQDRVMNEAYFGRARKRVSLARYARLMDYHIHQGNQAHTWLALNVSVDQTVGTPTKRFGVWTGQTWQDPSAVIFASTQAQDCFTDLNQLSLYTWSDVVTALDAGTTQADLVKTAGISMTKAEADALVTLFQREDITHLLVEQKLNPDTGTANGRDKTARQVVQLLDGTAAAEAVEDPAGSPPTWCVRVHWREEDKLLRRTCFITECEGQPITRDVSVFHGNLIRVTHGRPHTTKFVPPDKELGFETNDQLIHTDEVHFEKTAWGTLCPLPHEPLAYLDTHPGGEAPTFSTLAVRVSGLASAWQERSDLIESESGDLHFVVETDELDHSCIRFGNNVNGRALAQDADVTCDYQIGRGSLGNVGADVLNGFDRSPSGFPGIIEVWNPLDVVNGRDPEPVEEILRRVPQAYRTRQLRAVTLEDYVKRAEELPEVSHAHARYAWTGSWRTVRVSIDPQGTDTLNEPLRRTIASHLDAVRLIGEDLEIRGAKYAALDILLRLCAHPDHWPENLELELEQEFSDGYTLDGRPGFFHPDHWTFGQPLHASQVIGRALWVKGVERVLLLSMRRWYAVASMGASPPLIITPGDLPINEVDSLTVHPEEIIQVQNDPNHLERGRIQFDILGGRR
jgi:hypothetical protein